LSFKRLSFITTVSKRMSCAGYMAHMSERTNITGVWWGNLKERDYLEDPGIGRRTILECTLNRQDDRVWTGLF
jgi:hypothetical protein